MKKWVFIAYLIMMAGGFAWIFYADSNSNYTEKFDLMVESKVRAPQGAKWVVNNGNRYQLVNLGNTRFIFVGLKYGDVLEVRVNDKKNIIASLRFEGNQIYTVEEYEKNLEGLVDAMYRTMRNISIVFLVIMLFLVRNPHINNNLFSD
ncbi:hypothetical protein MARLIPOL_11831 [Marinobacter lipolyticus SM19]|uniref:Uncharacterized protein n=1 Tax=Marinobacter lipolyticus SM19 TaxID=1318628 RepID=R8B154_9GAMM|nr:hypothetical protein [Marinobacter lipolyticus]EON92311.1 hypothetical protein MARLIPOL_11831 [Marinobacter lipolyticus SM19]